MFILFHSLRAQNISLNHMSRLSFIMCKFVENTFLEGSSNELHITAVFLYQTEVILSTV